MSLRGFFDFSELYSSAGEVVDASLRKIFEFDAFAGKNRFPAVVLNNPVPVNPATAGLFTNANKKENPSNDQKLLGDTVNQIGTFSFRARIIGPNSPHNFLPDPCAAEISTNLPPDSQFKLISMHTMFLSPNDYSLPAGEDLPSRGDVVMVELEQNTFGYNLQVGTFVSLLKKQDMFFNVETLTGQACLDSEQVLQFTGESVGSFRLDLSNIGTGVPVVGPLKMSNAGLQQLIRDEAIRTQVYDDKNGKAIPSYDVAIGYPTIGVGHLITRSERDKFAPYLSGGKHMTKSQVLDLLSQDIPKYETPGKKITKPVTQEMFDALVSMAFNTGPNSHAVRKCIAAINQEDYAGAARAIANGPKTSKGQFMPGLAVAARQRLNILLLAVSHQQARHNMIIIIRKLNEKS